MAKLQNHFRDRLLFDAAGSHFVARRMLGVFRDNALTRQDFHGYPIGWKR